MKKDKKSILNLIFLSVLVCATLLLSGCNAKLTDKLTETTVTIKKNGQIVYQLVDVFDKDYYDFNELVAMAQLEVETFEAGGVTFDGWHQSLDGSNRVMLQFKFADWQTFADFNQEQLYYGTVGEALAKKLMTDATLTEYSDKKVLVTDVKAKFICPGDVLHTSVGVKITENGKIDTVQTDGVCVIVFD